MAEQHSPQEKLKKYDYLNKYNQHEILQRAYEDEINRSKLSPASPQKNSPTSTKHYVSEFKNCISSEITTQNSLLSEQVKEYKILVSKLERELTVTKEECAIISERARNDKSYYEKVIGELESQVENYRCRYQILNQDLIDTTQIKEENEELKIRLKNCSMELEQFQDQFKDYLNELSTVVQGDNLKSFQLTGCIKEGMKRKQVLEDFVEKVAEMRKKILESPQLCTDLKSLWKWLKEVGSLNSYILKVKPLLAEKAKVSSSLSGEQIIEHLLISPYH